LFVTPPPTSDERISAGVCLQNMTVYLIDHLFHHLFNYPNQII